MLSARSFSFFFLRRWFTWALESCNSLVRFTVSSVGVVCGKWWLFSQTNRFSDTRVAWYSFARWPPPTTVKETSCQDPPHWRDKFRPSWLQWNASRNRTMIWRNNYVKETQDTMFNRKTRKTVPNEGNQKGQRAVTRRANQSVRTWAFHLSWIQPHHLLPRRCRRWRNKWRLWWTPSRDKSPVTLRI